MGETVYNSPNQNRKFIRAANIIADKIADIDGVIGVVASGGIGRGHSDRFSDLDLLVYADDNKAREIGKYIGVGYLYHKGIHYDTPVESYQRALARPVPSACWSQVARWTLANSIILHDKGGQVAALFSEKLVFPETERRKLMKHHRTEALQILNFMFPLWEARGQAYHLASILRRAAEHIILWIYAKNGKFQPDLTKWLFYHLENKLVPEARYFDIIHDFFVRPISDRNQARRTQAELFDLGSAIGMVMERVTWEEMTRQHRANWENASEKTRYYLSW